MTVVGKTRQNKGGVEKATGFLELVVTLRGKKAVHSERSISIQVFRRQ